MIENEPKIIKGGSQNKQKRRRIKKYVRKLKEDYLPRLKKYREQMATFGDRKSYAKMDIWIRQIAINNLNKFNDAD